MTLQEIKDQVLELSLEDRWQLVRFLLSSMQHEPPIDHASIDKSFSQLDAWTQNLIGVIQLDSTEPTECYVNYLEEKYS